MPSMYPFATKDYQRGEIAVGGQVFFVGNRVVAGRVALDSLAHGRTPDTPYSTIAYAMQRCIPNNGDTIYVLPGHAGTISNATHHPWNVAGVTIKGLGHGLNRPTLTLGSATTTTIPVSAANIRVQNMVFIAGFADIVSLFTLGAASHFRVEGCTIRNSAANLNFLHVFDTNTTDAAANGLTFLNNNWFEPDAATLAFGLVDAAIDELNISQNTMVTGAATANIAALLTIATGKNLTNLRIYENNVYLTGNAGSTAAVFITTDGTAGTGLIVKNNVSHADITTELFITATHTWGLFDNKMTAVRNAQGYLVPVVDA